ncbi:MAG: hypothetical protein K8M05_08985, partial [Deltaproteobacteria bacterium]|nr:hypothetical protein [Kofleriaceae bacterium]
AGRRQAAPRFLLIRDLPLLSHRFLLGTDEALGRPPRCHPGVADGSRCYRDWPATMKERRASMSRR